MALRPFRFWCQKVLPLVYDDSLSYYELLCKVVKQLNDTGEVVNLLNEYVYALDIDKAVEDKLDKWATDGTLDQLLKDYVIPDGSITDNKLSIDTFIPRRYILIGDSYGEGFTPDGNVEGWTVKLTNLLEKNGRNKVIASKSVGGTAFVPNAGLQGQSFLTILQSISVESPRSITDIVVVGGYNEPDNSSLIDENIKTFLEYTGTNYPNATVHIGCCCVNFTNVGKMSALRNTVRVSYSKCITLGAVYLKDVFNALHNYTYMSSDGYHPNELGQVEIASCVYQNLSGNRYSPEYYKKFSISDTSEISAPGVKLDGWVRITDDNVIITVDSRVAFTAGSYTFTGNDGFALIRDIECLRPMTDEVLKRSTASVQVDGVYQLATVSYKTLNRSLYTYNITLNDSGSGWKTFSNMTAILYPRISFIIPLTEC